MLKIGAALSFAIAILHVGIIVAGGSHLCSPRAGGFPSDLSGGSVLNGARAQGDRLLSGCLGNRRGIPLGDFYTSEEPASTAKSARRPVLIQVDQPNLYRVFRLRRGGTLLSEAAHPESSTS